MSGSAAGSDSYVTGVTTAGTDSYATGVSETSDYSSGRDTAFESKELRDDEDVIPVVEERLRIGKRDVNLGHVRVRSYVVEEPVTESVQLRQDRVEIERRRVDRELTGTESDFTDRIIEAEEHAEEAVIAKDARVVEEIALRRGTEQRTEMVSDTVRRTEVEVEDERDASRSTTSRRS